MGYSLALLPILSVVILVWSSHATAQTCMKTFSAQNKVFTTCNDLTELNAGLSWTYYPQTGSIDMAFRAKPAATNGWVAWGINPTTTGMIGTQTLIAFRHSNGTTIVDTYDVKSKTAALQPSTISITVANKSAVFENGEITIFATVSLPSNKTTVNHVWQVGSGVTGSSPQVHATASANLASYGSVNLQNGTSTGSSGIPHKTLKDRHGVINVVGWGILMPIGVMIARYMRMFESANPAWFYMHALCQSSGYILGVAGWATGLKLGSYSKGIERTAHRKLGIALFCLGTLQVFALLLRPKKEHKFRIYWNVYHHTVGYSVIILSIVNIFKGFDILQPEDKWKHAYIGVIASLGGIAVILEIVTWIIFFQRKSKNSLKSFNGTNSNGGMNGHGIRHSQDV
eukprot:Gb_13521 [translate_table: standard]